MIFPINQKKIIHNFSDSNLIINHISSYTIEEILIEKMRTILQRFYPRDLYDVCFILSNHTFNPGEIKKSFLQKCEFKNVPFSSVNDFFDNKRLENARKAWNNSLSHLIKNLPDFDMVIKSLYVSLALILK
jgi:predicted nucleotidyltransferase component of viral defense system